MNAPNPVTADGYNAQVLSELREQSKLLKSVDEKLSLLVSHLGAGKRSSGGTRGGGEKEVATDDELDGKWGNPEVKRDPNSKHWDGASYVGSLFSECPSDYLEALAKYKEASAWVKEKNSPDDATQMKYVGYDRRDAKLARGWALRNKQGGPAVHQGSNASVNERASSSNERSDSFGSDDDIPF